MSAPGGGRKRAQAQATLGLYRVIDVVQEDARSSVLTAYDLRLNRLVQLNVAWSNNGDIEASTAERRRLLRYAKK